MRNAIAQGRSCTQLHLTGVLELGGEDCLYLDVYVPPGAAADAKLPVLFWIYGGGFIFGDSNEFGWYDGTNFAKRSDVVFVAANYRVGPLGYLATPELQDEDPNRSTGNYGMQDQVLYWLCHSQYYAATFETIFISRRACMLMVSLMSLASLCTALSYFAGRCARMGRCEYRLVRRRSGARHHLWRIGGRHQCVLAPRVDALLRAVSRSHHGIGHLQRPRILCQRTKLVSVLARVDRCVQATGGCFVRGAACGIRENFLEPTKRTILFFCTLCVFYRFGCVRLIFSCVLPFMCCMCCATTTGSVGRLRSAEVCQRGCVHGVPSRAARVYSDVGCGWRRDAKGIWFHCIIYRCLFAR